ncbi:MAG: flagellar biosynthesis protein FlhB [Betaproteobacteria bacterium]|nr:flagellar biosynthesis protein FlhB [Betaproteobacteria bacterium]
MSYRRQAIALEYGQHLTPVVTAKGDEEIALAMIAQAQANGVYITQDPQLLALLSRLNVDDEIPPELYAAVSVILSWVYWLKGMRPGDEKGAASAAAADTAEFGGERIGAADGVDLGGPSDPVDGLA